MSPVSTHNSQTCTVASSQPEPKHMLAYTVPQSTSTRDYHTAIQNWTAVYGQAAPHYYFRFPGFAPASPCCAPSVEWHPPCGFPIPRLHQPSAAILCAPECPPYAPDRQSVAPRGCGRCGRCAVNRECLFYWGATRKQHIERMLQEEEFVPKLGLY